MARLRRRAIGDELNPWPGYVDALSTLLMVIIFVLLVFVLSQAFLSVSLTGRDRALDRLNRQVAELTDMLSLERGRSGELQQMLARLDRDLQAAGAARDEASSQLALLRDERAHLSGDRDALRAERDRLSARLSDAEAQAQSAASRAETLQARLADAAGRTDAAGQETATVAGQLAEARRQLAQARAQLAELDRTVQADKATIEARLADLARLGEETRRLTALRDELERQAREAAARATSEEQQRVALAARLSEEQRLGDSARARIALLTREVEDLRGQLGRLAAALDAAERSGRDKDARIGDLGARLNLALADKVEELQRYRSEFFGRLRQVLQNRSGIQVVGDRFVFQSEVLFPVGSPELTRDGQDGIRALARTLKEVAAQIPRDLDWILRVDGHADRQPVRGAFASNWELSSQRAINVVKLLVEEGVPANRLVAAGFGEHQPLDPGEGPAAYARNRRIEVRLTDR